MAKHTIALTCIMKNERQNLPRLLQSVSGCFNEIHFTDTGSNDGSVEYASSLEASIIARCPIHVHHFEWINDFAAARNHALEFIKTDYWMWLDLDDALSNSELFKLWRDTAMPLFDLWLTPYWYAFKDGKPVCSFLRERVVKNGKGLTFKDFVHEGIESKYADGSPVMSQLVNTWHVDHVRTEEELNGDRGRNLALLEAKKDNLSPRMRFYLGKEYFDNQRFEEAAEALASIIGSQEIEAHDRILGLQYLGNALFNTKHYPDCISFCLQGLQLAPTRAEFYCMIGDCYLLLGQFQNAIPNYMAAMNCADAGSGGNGFVFTMPEVYEAYPKRQLATALFNLGMFYQAKQYLVGQTDPMAVTLSLDCDKALAAMDFETGPKTRVDHIVITCPPQGAYPWDTKIYKEKGIGGSETAACEMASWIRGLTGRQVIIFNPREQDYVDQNGIIFKPSRDVQAYFKQFSPELHIAWRHSTRLTDEPSFIWCHDLITAGAENLKNYDKILCLSEFHRRYVMSMQGIPEDKILVTRNGVNPERFTKPIEKQYGKVIWPNSPDRGLVDGIKVMDQVVKVIPEAELHIFYGFANMDKYGQKAEADKMREMIAERPWIKFHGNVDQATLADEMRSSMVWLYPTWFMETYCITALEALLCKAWPVVRNIGALENTLAEASEKGMCDLLDLPVNDYEAWADKVIRAIEEEKWKTMDIDPTPLSWESVAKDWISLFKL